jgi:hypothetical protein
VWQAIKQKMKMYYFDFVTKWYCLCNKGCDQRWRIINIFKETANCDKQEAIRRTENSHKTTL